MGVLPSHDHCDDRFKVLRRMLRQTTCADGQERIYQRTITVNATNFVCIDSSRDLVGHKPGNSFAESGLIIIKWTIIHSHLNI